MILPLTVGLHLVKWYSHKERTPQNEWQDLSFRFSKNNKTTCLQRRKLYAPTPKTMRFELVELVRDSSSRAAFKGVKIEDTKHKGWVDYARDRHPTGTQQPQKTEYVEITGVTGPFPDRNSPLTSSASHTFVTLVFQEYTRATLSIVTPENQSPLPIPHPSNAWRILWTALKTSRNKWQDISPGTDNKWDSSGILRAVSFTAKSSIKNAAALKISPCWEPLLYIAAVGCCSGDGSTHGKNVNE